MFANAAQQLWHKGSPLTGTRKTTTATKAAIMALVAFAWLAIDLATKNAVAGHVVGQTFAGPFLGLIDFTLVHNKGGAWGVFSDSTVLLGAFSLVVCVLLALYVLVLDKESRVPEAVCAGLIIAGGLGNAYDRFVNGYVIDFIRTTFIDFPVFNIADIGVTCGLAALLILLMMRYSEEGKVARGEVPGQEPETEVIMVDPDDTMFGYKRSGRGAGSDKSFKTGKSDKSGKSEKAGKKGKR